MVLGEPTAETYVKFSVLFFKFHLLFIILEMANILANIDEPAIDYIFSYIGIIGLSISAILVNAKLLKTKRTLINETIELQRDIAEIQEEKHDIEIDYVDLETKELARSLDEQIDVARKALIDALQRYVDDNECAIQRIEEFEKTANYFFIIKKR